MLCSIRSVSYFFSVIPAKARVSGQLQSGGPGSALGRE